VTRVPDGRGRLHDECLQATALPDAQLERRASEQGEHAQERALERDGQAQIAGEAARLAPVSGDESRIGGDAADVQRAAMERHPADSAVSIGLGAGGILAGEALVGQRLPLQDPGVLVGRPDHDQGRARELGRGGHHRVQHVLEIEGRRHEWMGAGRPSRARLLRRGYGEFLALGMLLCSDAHGLTGLRLDSNTGRGGLDAPCDTIRPLMTRVIAAAGLFVAVACNALAWPLPFGLATGNRLARGAGTFPRWQALALATEAPIRWLVTLPGRRLAAVDRDGALVIFEIAASGLRVAARYGGVASPDGPARGGAARSRADRCRARGPRRAFARLERGRRAPRL
jgi:hypothetical protein